MRHGILKLIGRQVSMTKNKKDRRVIVATTIVKVSYGKVRKRKERRVK
jgi:hypothetical protein